MSHIHTTGKFSALLNSNDSKKAIRHSELWTDFIANIKHISNNPKYAEISLMIHADLEDD